jgi:hypothetical protein
MDIILALIQYLLATLAPTEILVVIALLGLASFFAVKFALKRKNAIMSFFAKDEDEDETLKRINEKLAMALTREEFKAAMAQFELVVKHELEENTKTIDVFKEKFVEIATIRQDINDREFQRVIEQIDESREIFLAQYEKSAQQHALILSSTTKLHDAQSKTLSQVEKIDEYVRAAVPEFRGYHRDLGSDLKMLGRDLALIERSFQMNINSNSAIKLR